MESVSQSVSQSVTAQLTGAMNKWLTIPLSVLQPSYPNVSCGSYSNLQRP